MRIRMLLLVSVVFLLAPATGAQTKTINFDSDSVGKAPAGFSFALTGQGKPGVWVIARDGSSPGHANVLAQTDPDPTGFRFPVAVFDGLSAADVDISVSFKPISGKKDQGAGIVWRYKDNNYYIVRANALENNVVLYKLEKGKRTDLPLKGEGRTYGKKETVPSGQWGTLRVLAKGNLFEVYHDGKKLYEVEDDTFKDGGKVGVWTKADSVIYFDDLRITTK
ncbi:MAG: family 16 glycoside hydrolase [Blastocatellia bacterium]